MTIRELIRDVCRRHRVRLRDFYFRRDGEVSKTQRVAHARHEASYLAYQNLGVSLNQIAKVMRVHHTTVLYGIRKHRERLENPNVQLRGHRARQIAYGTDFDHGDWAH